MHDVPVVPAATVVLLADRPEVEVVLLTRRKASTFVGGMTVFPGGGVDEHDRDPVWSSFGFDAAERLGRPDPLGYWVAAVRETWEEVGIFLGNAAPPATHRESVDRDDMTFFSAVQAAGAAVDFTELWPIGRWITPEGAPRRYDTLFFVAKLTGDETLLADGREAVDAHWATPANALAEMQADQRILLPPTSVTLDIIGSYPTSDAVIAAAKRADPLHDGHRLHRLDGDPFASYFLPGSSAPDAAVPAEGWISLPVHTE